MYLSVVDVGSSFCCYWSRFDLVCEMLDCYELMYDDSHCHSNDDVSNSPRSGGS